LPAGRWWLLAALLVGLIALLLRQWVPVGSEAWGLQVGYFSSYVFLFALGCAASRPRWLERITAAVAKPWMIVSLVTIPLLPLALKFGGTPVKVETGWTFAAILYAFWEPFVAWGIIAGLLWLVRERLTAATRSGRRSVSGHTAPISCMHRSSCCWPFCCGAGRHRRC
jgi:hypothetical protein